MLLTLNTEMIIGLLITLYRKETNKSVRELAEEIGIDYSTLSKIESGRGVSWKVTPVILRWLFSKTA